jgi:peptide-methionine (S)-S-oxide reductase
MTERATFAAGCFWGVEAAFQNLQGVVDTRVGYSGGRTADPTYEDVCAGRTGHAESVQVEFDPAVTTYDHLLEVFWRIHDPCTPNRQGPDVGSQYRSVIFHHSEMQREIATSSKERLNRAGRCGRGRVVTEIVPFSVFYQAEEYHQRYLEKHDQASCSR